MKKTLLVTVVSLTLTLAGTAIAYNLLAQDSRAAKYQDFSGVAASAPAGQYGGCPGSVGRGGCGNCGGQGITPQQGAQGSGLQAIEELASRYYSDTYGDNDFTVKVQDYGCHQEAYILKGGQPVKKLSISGGNVYEVN